jgi:hypothetical protein
MISLKTPYRWHEYHPDPRRRTLRNFVTVQEEPFLMTGSWVAVRKATDEFLTLDSALLDEDEIELRVPTEEDWARIRTSKPTPRAYTEEEVREMFLKHLWGLVDYWATVEGKDSPKTVRDRLSGLMHSTLTTLDGCSMGLPGFEVRPHPHESDKDYHQERGENWFPDDVDIGGSLHELMYKFDPQRKK